MQLKTMPKQWNLPFSSKFIYVFMSLGVFARQRMDLIDFQSTLTARSHVVFANEKKNF